MLRMRKRLIDGIWGFTGNIFDRPVIPGRLTQVPDNKEGKKPFHKDDGYEKKDHHPGGKG